MLHFGTYLLQLLRSDPGQARGQKPGGDSPDLHAIVQQSPVPLAHDHIKPGLGTTVRRSIHANGLLRPASGWRRVKPVKVGRIAALGLRERRSAAC